MQADRHVHFDGDLRIQGNGAADVYGYFRVDGNFNRNFGFDGHFCFDGNVNAQVNGKICVDGDIKGGALVEGERNGHLRDKVNGDGSFDRHAEGVVKGNNDVYGENFVHFKIYDYGDGFIEGDFRLDGDNLIQREGVINLRIRQRFGLLTGLINGISHHCFGVIERGNQNDIERQRDNGNDEGCNWKPVSFFHNLVPDKVTMLAFRAYGYAGSVGLHCFNVYVPGVFIFRPIGIMIKVKGDGPLGFF
ncbi:MAG: hypothetical protein B6243_08880 [Anaerolineaceae bacterium 4572_5.2]|nr:MAG: hypothetical protein B6243_08880 [Anaerolineaceae bacterium 4572_5.2]